MTTLYNKDFFDGKIWEGVYDDFSDARKICSDLNEINVWNDELWLNNQVTLINKSKISIDEKEYIKSIAETNDYFLPYLVTVMDTNKQLNVLDFGGGLGELYLKMQQMIVNFDIINFTIVENQKIVDIGNLHFSNKNLNYRTDIPKDIFFDIINFGSSFHYIDDWKALIKQIIFNKPQYLIFSDLPCSDNESFVTIQNYNGKKIPVRFLNILELINFLKENDFNLILKSRHKSKYLSNLSNFDEKYKLKYFSQLAFKCISN
jgi:putative methyltransferase (TIGR04325 family)